MGEIWSKKCEQGRDFRDHLACRRQMRILCFGRHAFSPAGSLLGTGVFPEAEGPEFDAAAACRYRERGVGASADVLCVDWSPFCTEHFAVAVADGTVGVYTAEASRPRLVLPAPSALPLLAVRWSCDRPSLLFALDAGSTVFVWDLMEAAKDSSSVRLRLIGHWTHFL